MQKEKILIPVSETFYSIQGEGQTMGVPAVFLRLGGCNLWCESSCWRCDTIEVWTKSVAKPLEECLPPEDLMWLTLEGNNAHLVITGGEPLLHQEKVVKLIQYLNEVCKKKIVVEIETNGTILPSKELLELVSYWNCSPKLSTSGEKNTFEKRVNVDVLKLLSQQNEKTIFKFVVSEISETEEIKKDFLPHVLSSQIVLMPAGSTQEELNKTRQRVMAMCKLLSVRYSDRLHIVGWDKKTGV